MDRNIRKVFIIFNFLLYLPLILLLAMGITGRDYSRNQRRNGYLIGASYMTMNNEFYKILNEEISSRA